MQTDCQVIQLYLCSLLKSRMKSTCAFLMQFYTARSTTKVKLWPCLRCEIHPRGPGDLCISPHQSSFSCFHFAFGATSSRFSNRSQLSWMLGCVRLFCRAYHIFSFHRKSLDLEQGYRYIEVWSSFDWSSFDWDKHRKDSIKADSRFASCRQ